VEIEKDLQVVEVGEEAKGKGRGSTSKLFFK